MASKATKAKSVALPGSKGTNGGFESTLVAKLANGVEAHRAGNLDTAEENYRAVLELSPDHPHALHFMGVIEHQRGNNEQAVELIKRAIAILPNFADAYSNLGAAYYAQGKLVSAERNFRRAAELNPDIAEAHSNLGAVLEDQNRFDEAVTSYKAAAKAAPNRSKYMKLLGSVLLRMERFEEAVAWFDRFLGCEKDDGEVSNNLGYAYERLEKYADAQEWYGRAVKLCADSPEINRNFAAMLAHNGREDEAQTYFQRALDLAPDKWEDLAELAGNYVNRGEPSRAVPIYQQLVELRPDDSQMWNDFAVATTNLGHMTLAEKYFQKAIELDPDCHEAYNNLGSNLLIRGLRDQAIVAFKKAIELSPKYLAPHINLCLCLGFAERLDEGYVYAQAVLMHEDYEPDMFSNPHKIFRAVCDFDAIEAQGETWIDLEKTFTGDYSANFLEMLVLADNEKKTKNLVQLHYGWGSTLMQRLPGKKLEPVAPGSRSGKIRIGILSSDLRSHAVAKFALPMLRFYDREKFEIIVYSPYEEHGDIVQQHIKDLVAAFKITQDMNEYEIAQLIRADEIDILFELNGFTRDNRLKVFPYKPAPVQIFWLGYPFTVGIPEVDYILLDKHLCPEDTSTLVEKPLLMPESWVCFGTLEDEPINPQPPVERNGYITFGSLNNCYKLTRKTIAQWCEIMNRVPDSRFMYIRPECKSLILCNNLINEFGSHGIGPERLYMVNNSKVGISHLSFYDELDITLDTFPLTGGTTTCDSMWMGVPVISKVGPALHQRLSYALMAAIGLDELCVKTDEEYIEKAVALAQDVESIRFLRKELRPMILTSSLCRAEDYASNFCKVMTEVAERHGLR